MMEKTALTTLVRTGLLTVCATAMAMTSVGCVLVGSLLMMSRPKTFVQSTPGWKVIELRPGLVGNYDDSWQTAVDSIARTWDIEVVDKESGYLRTAWVHGISGARYNAYRGRITLKFPRVKDPKKVDVKTEAQWLRSASGYYGQTWVKGFDSSFQRDVFAELSGRLGRTVPAE